MKAKAKEPLCPSRGNSYFRDGLALHLQGRASFARRVKSVFMQVPGNASSFPVKLDNITGVSANVP